MLWCVDTRITDWSRSTITHFAIMTCSSFPFLFKYSPPSIPRVVWVYGHACRLVAFQLLDFLRKTKLVQDAGEFRRDCSRNMNSFFRLPCAATTKTKHMLRRIQNLFYIVTEAAQVFNVNLNLISMLDMLLWCRQWKMDDFEIKWQTDLWLCCFRATELKLSKRCRLTFVWHSSWFKPLYL